MTIPAWRSLLVRVWRDRDGLKIRFLTVDPDANEHRLTTVTTTESAVACFDTWLDGMVEPGPHDSGGRPTPRGSDGADEA